MIFNTVIRGSDNNEDTAAINPYLEEVYIDENWTSDNVGGLYNAYNLKKITIECKDTVPEVSYPLGALFGEKEFDNTNIILQSIVTKANEVETGKLIDYYVPNSFKILHIKKGIVPKGFCYGMLSLETLIIDDEVTEIQDRAFDECYNLKNIYFGKKCSSIVEDAFVCCSSLEHVHFSQINTLEFKSSSTLTTSISEYFPIKTYISYETDSVGALLKNKFSTNIMDKVIIKDWVKKSQYFSLDNVNEEKKTATLSSKTDQNNDNFYYTTLTCFNPYYIKNTNNFNNYLLHNQIGDSKIQIDDNDDIVNITVTPGGKTV